MIKDIRKRFILFNVLVTGGIIAIIGLSIFVGSPRSELPAHRYVTALSLAVVSVYVGSLILSKAAIRPIQAAWQKQLDFTADASHELRTPLAVIQTNFELVMDSPKETVESQMKWLKNIEAENKRMAKLVDDLLTLSRADTDRQTLEKETFMLDEAVAEAAAPFEPIASEKNIELAISADGRIAFYGDRRRIKQLVVILLDNALNYTDSGAVAVALSQEEKGVILTVSDTGHGIEIEHISKIFDRFYRVEKTRNLHRDGSGLGLSIAKWIVEEHSGAICVTSTIGKETILMVRLPRLPISPLRIG